MTRFAEALGLLDRALALLENADRNCLVPVRDLDRNCMVPWVEAWKGWRMSLGVWKHDYEKVRVEERREVICVYCAAIFEQGELLSAHEWVCERHPLLRRIHHLEAELAAASKALPPGRLIPRPEGGLTFEPNPRTA